jgi:hypothetical protein
MTPLELSEVTLQVVSSPTIIILMTLEVLFTLLENIYSPCITRDGHNLGSSYLQATEQASLT